jgi:hypothetical protein
MVLTIAPWESFPIKRLLAVAFVLAFGSMSLAAEEKEPSTGYSKKALKTDLKAAGRQSKEAAFSAGRAIKKGAKNAAKGVKQGFQHAGEGNSRNAAQKKVRPARQ